MFKQTKSLSRVITVLSLLLLVLSAVSFTSIGQDDMMEMASCEGEALTDDSPVVTLGAAVSDTGKYAREGGDTRNGYTIWLDWVNDEYGGINVAGRNPNS